MTDGTNAPDLTLGLRAARAVVRDHLFALARQYQTLNTPDLEQQLALLNRLADAAGFHIVAGLARALGDRLAEGTGRAEEAGQDCAPVFLHYMTRALTLEPSSDRAILSLLLDGVQRRLDEARQHSPQMEA
ncbi:MAG TPA: hypothetical protein VKZ46_00160 [Pedomonas sp.]|nr:hypothetical protein [Pedomonas sp.]